MPSDAINILGAVNLTQRLTVKRLAYFGIGLALICQPVNAQDVSQRITPYDGAPNHGDWIIPTGIGGAGAVHQINRPMPMLVDPEDPEGSMQVPSDGGFFADSRTEADQRCKSRGFKKAERREFLSGGSYYVCVN